MASQSYHIGPSQGVQFQDLKYLIRRIEMFIFFINHLPFFVGKESHEKKTVYRFYNEIVYSFPF